MFSNDDIALWVAERMDYPYPFAEGFQTLCKSDGDKITAGVVFENYLEDRDIHMHVAAEGRWATSDFLQHVFEYPFSKLGCARVTGFVADPQKLKFYQLLGFTIEGCLRSALPDGDLYIVGMLRDECKYYGKAIERPTGAT